MKNILCYGDSITWGFNPADHTRFNFDQRWTGILQSLLGSDYRIIEEGLNGRTTVHTDHFTPFKQYGSGIETLPMILDSHRPLDLLVIMLGANDLQPHRQCTMQDVARGVSMCVISAMNTRSGIDFAPPKILIVSPPRFSQAADYMECIFHDMNYDADDLDRFYQMTAEAYGAEYLSGSSVNASAADGIHLDITGNQQLAELLHQKITTL